jgi:hypothetical protein
VRIGKVLNMDLANCKLICRSKSRTREKLECYKYWESAGKPQTNCLEHSKNDRGRLVGSKSVPRILQKICEKEKHKESVISKCQSYSRGVLKNKNLKRLCPLKIIENKEFQNPSWEDRFIITGNNLRKYLKQPVYKVQEEKINQDNAWAQSIYRNSLVGDKIIKIKSKSSVREKSRYDRPEEYERRNNCGNLDSERQIYEYKEPYLQVLLKRNPRNFSDLFYNPTNIL